MGSKKPILIFKGDIKVCYGILRVFSDELKNALTDLGEEVIYLDVEEDIIEPYIDKEYKAVIAFMEVIFSNRTPGGNDPLFDHFYGPKFNYWPDHPAVFYKQLVNTPKDYYILTQDGYYAKYINKHYKSVSKAFYFPPAGSIRGEIRPFSERRYEVSFLGTFKDWQKQLKIIQRSDPQTRVIGEKFLEILVSYPDLTTEAAFEKTMRELGARPTEKEFVEALHQIHWLADEGVAKFYRQEMINHLIESGIDIDVFGDTWKNAPFADNPHLHIHPTVPADRIADIYRDSKVSLNMMTWHKDCITERVLDSMLAGSIAVSDETAALKNEFVYNDGINDDKAEVLLYDLKNLEALPDIIRSHINDEKLAKRGYEKALEKHTWKNRAKKLLEIIDEVT